MDIVTKSQFDQFKTQFGLAKLSDEDAFELFVIYSVASKYTKSDSVSKDLLTELNIGSGGDWGIDGIIPIINGKIVASIQEVEDLYYANQYLNVHIVFVQAKTSEHFDLGDFSKTLDGVENIFRDVVGESISAQCNSDLQDFRELIKYIYSKSADFYNGVNPVVSIYYATSGVNTDLADFKSKIDSTRTHIERYDLTSCVECFLCGRREVIQLYKDTKTQISATIRVDQKISMPEVDRVDESYLCLLQFSEFKKLLMDDNGDIQNSIFNDNIRAFQGENTVNQSIAQSIQRGDISLFTAMNNGITVIAKEMRTTGQSIFLSDYQIVNGCQTSNVLYMNKDVQGIDSLKLIVKLIASNDKGIRDKIIVGNNSQTEVKREQLVSLLEVQKTIEDYYIAQTKYEKLYYERRSKQFRTDGGKVPQNKVITIPFQIKSFVSMILGEPHSVRGYYGSIVQQFDKNGMKVFSSDFRPELYYTSALACFKMTELFASKEIDRKYKKMKYHLLYAFRLMCEKTDLPEYNSNKTEAYCDHLCSLLMDDERCKKGFDAAMKMVDIALKRDPTDSDSTSKVVTNTLKKLAREANNYRKKC